MKTQIVKDDHFSDTKIIDKKHDVSIKQDGDFVMVSKKNIPELIEKLKLFIK